MVENDKLINMADSKQFDEIWNSFCNEVFEYHNKQLTNLDKKQKEEYLKTISKLEFKIWTIVKLGGFIDRNNLGLILHKDFEKAFNRFWQKKFNN